MSELVSEQVSQSVCQKSKFKFKTVKALVSLRRNQFVKLK